MRAWERSLRSTSANDRKVPRVGVEPTRPCGRRILSPQGDSASPDSDKPSDDARADDSSRRSNENEIDADLQRILDAWPTLPAALKTGILAMIGAARR